MRLQIANENKQAKTKQKRNKEVSKQNSKK